MKFGGAMNAFTKNIFCSLSMVMCLVPIVSHATEMSSVLNGGGNVHAGSSCGAAVLSSEVKRYLESGSDLEKKQDLEGAIACYSRAVVIDPQSPQVYFHLAEAQFKAERFQAALLNYTLAITIEPNHVGALHGRSRVCFRLALHGQALKDLSKLIKLIPGNAEFHYQRAKALLKLRSVRSAYQDFLKAHELDNRYPRPTLLGDEEPVGKKAAILYRLLRLGMMVDISKVSQSQDEMNSLS